MKNLKKLSRNNLKAVHGGDEEKSSSIRHVYSWVK